MGERGIEIRDVEYLKELLRRSPFHIKGAFPLGSRAREAGLRKATGISWSFVPSLLAFAFPIGQPRC